MVVRNVLNGHGVFLNQTLIKFFTILHVIGSFVFKLIFIGYFYYDWLTKMRAKKNEFIS